MQTAKESWNIRSVPSLASNSPVRAVSDGAVLMMKGEQEGFLVLADGGFTKKRVSDGEGWVRQGKDSDVSIIGSRTRTELGER